MKLIQYILVTLILTFFVQEWKAQASFTHSTSGLSVSFTSTSSVTSSATYVWYFGDGDTSTLQNPNHTYVSPGSYSVILRVTDSSWIDSAFATVTTASCPLSASFSDSTIGTTSNFTSNITGAFGVITYLWDFGDASTSNLANPSHNYSRAGPFNVTLIATDTTGCSDTVTIVIRCNLTANYTHVSTGLTTSFTSTATGTTPSTIYLWRFGDGTTSTLQNPVHTYASAGTYYPVFIVSDSLCNDSVYSSPVTVIRPPCAINASFVETVTGLSVTFNSTSTGAISPTSYTWDFGDGSFGTGSTNSHTYSSSGVYSITLTVTDSLCSDSSTRIVAVTANVFTPNGDGIDDVFYLTCSGIAASVYNTSGVLIKTLPSGVASWDGTNNLGGNQPTGLYFILCSGSSTPVSVTLIR